MASIKRRQGDGGPPVLANAVDDSGPIKFATQYTALMFRMVFGTTIVTGTATGDDAGNLTYNFAPTDLATAGTYNAVFVATANSTGRPETFPTGENLTVIVVPSV